MANEQQEQQNELDGWPLPSADVRRELDRRPLGWSEPVEPEVAQLSAAA